MHQEDKQQASWTLLVVKSLAIHAELAGEGVCISDQQKPEAIQSPIFPSSLELNRVVPFG